MNLQLRRFDPSKIGSDKVCLFIGKRGTGKSTLVTDIMYHKRDIPAGVVMSATEEGNHYYRQYIPDLFVHGKYDRETIERIIEAQKAKLNKYGKVAPVFVLLDDCMYDRSFLKDECIRTLFMNGRHWKIFFLMTTQYCMDLPPGLRTNVDYVFCLRENVIQNREKLYKSFFGCFPTFQMFQQVMDACTENYECLVLDNTLNECVFYYKAQLRSPFKMGSSAWWEYHRKHYNPRHSSSSSQQPIIKPRGPIVHVKKG
jgi:Poxvirus A32 protein